MSEIKVIAARETVESEDELAETARRTPGDGGGIVPTGLAGYVYDGAAYCPTCAAETETETADGETVTIAEFPAFETDGHGFGVGVISCTDESDYPGDSCFVCHKRLDTNVLVYRDGPGREVFDRLE